MKFIADSKDYSALSCHGADGKIYHVQGNKYEVYPMTFDFIYWNITGSAGAYILTLSETDISKTGTAGGRIDKADNDFSSSAPWESYKTGIITVNIQSGVHFKGTLKGLFKGLTLVETYENLDQIDFSEVTEITSLFENNQKMTAFDLTFLSTLPEIVSGEAWFSGCSALKSLTLADLDLSTITKTIRMFYACSAMTNIYVDPAKCFDLSKITTGNDELMFSQCTSLNNYDPTYVDKTRAYVDNGSNGGYLNKVISNKIYYKIDKDSNPGTAQLYLSDTSYGAPDFYHGEVSGEDLCLVDNANIAYYASSYTSVIIDANIKVTGTFKFVSGMASLISSFVGLDKIDTSEVTSMTEAFKGLEHMQSIDISGWDLSAVTNVKEMFKGCTKLTQVFVDPSKQFVPANITESTDVIDGAGFRMADTKYGAVLDRLIACDGTNLGILCNGKTNEYKIYWALYTSGSLAGTLELKASAFSGSQCMDAQNLYFKTIQDTPWNSSDVKSMVIYGDDIKFCGALDGLFANQINFATKYLDKCNMNKVQVFSNFMNNNNKMKWVDLHNFTTNLIEFTNVFVGAQALCYVEMYWSNLSQVKYTDAAFSGCKRLGTIWVKNNNAGFVPSTIVTSTDMFKNCTRLHNFNASYTDKSKAYIDKGVAFSGDGYLMAYDTDYINAFQYNFAWTLSDDYTLTLHFDFLDQDLDNSGLKDFGMQVSYRFNGANYWTNLAPDCVAAQKVVVTKPGSRDLIINAEGTTTGFFSGLRFCTEYEGLENAKVYSTQDFTSMFEDNRALTTLNLKIGNWSGVGRARIDKMFNNCVLLRDVFMEGCPASYVSGTNAFGGCTNIYNWDGTTDATHAVIDNGTNNGYFQAI